MKFACVFSAILATVSAQITCSTTGQQMTTTGRQNTINKHNTLRSAIAQGTYSAKGHIQGPATNMLKSVYSCPIEQQAQNYANNCVFEHSNTPGYGENLYQAWNSDPIDFSQAMSDACDSWEGEFQQFGWSNVTFSSSTQMNIGHATQLAWAKSNNIGCGIADCSDSEWYSVLIVCQYQPPGNVEGQKVYQKGTTCSACDTGFSCETATGLCA